MLYKTSELIAWSVQLWSCGSVGWSVASGRVHNVSGSRSALTTSFYQYISPRTASVHSLVLSIIYPHSPLVHGDGQSSVKNACQLFAKQKEREFALLTSRLGFILGNVFSPVKKKLQYWNEMQYDLSIISFLWSLRAEITHVFNTSNKSLCGSNHLKMSFMKKKSSFKFYFYHNSFKLISFTKKLIGLTLNSTKTRAGNII